MARHVMGEARYVDGQLAEVTFQCIDKAEAPIIFLEAQIVSVDDVVDKLRFGDKVLAVWSHPDGGVDLPVEIVTLPNGEESIEVVAGGPAGYRMVDLKSMDS
jgi:hypothetical protein